jgi:hypothetical protein
MAGTCGYGEGLSGSINVGNFLTSCKVHWLASQEGLCSPELYMKYGFHTMRVVSVNTLTCKHSFVGILRHADTISK